MSNKLSKSRMTGLLTVALTLAVPTAAGAATVTANGNWGVVNRNTEGAASAALRAGPAPHSGSVGISVGDANSKVDWGNEVDFAGVPLSGVSALGLSVFQTGENAGINTGNLPNVTLEIDPTGSADGTAPNYTSLNGISPPVDPGSLNAWSNVVPTQFYMTGAAGTASGCNQVTYCTLAQVKAFYPNAQILTVGINKGKDYAWHGSVDNFVLGSTTYDFEFPTGPAGPAGSNGSNGSDGSNGANGANGANGSAGVTAASGVILHPVAVGSAKVSWKKVKVRVKCPKSAGTCDGNLRLTKRSKTISRTAFTIDGGKSQTVTLKVKPKLKKSSFKLVAFSRDDAGQGVKTTKAFSGKVG